MSEIVPILPGVLLGVITAVALVAVAYSFHRIAGNEWDHRGFEVILKPGESPAEQRKDNDHG